MSEELRKAAEAALEWMQAADYQIDNEFRSEGFYEEAPEIGALRAALARPSAVQEWRPIASAPRDEMILMWGSAGPYIGEWGRYARFNHPKFTHWMPLDAPEAESRPATEMDHRSSGPSAQTECQEKGSPAMPAKTAEGER